MTTMWASRRCRWFGTFSNRRLRRSRGNLNYRAGRHEYYGAFPGASEVEEYALG
jgi:hypothetical protein